MIALTAALVGVIVVLVVGRRRSLFRRPQGVSEADELRRAQFELRWARQLSALTETLDLDELLARVLQGAVLLADADAAAAAGRGVAASGQLATREALPLADHPLPLSR